MAAFILTTAEVAALAAFDIDLDTAFTGGLADGGGNILVPKLAGYETTTDELKPLVRQSFEVAIVPLLRVLAAAVQAWVEIGSPGAPAFQNGWVNYGSSFATAAYYIDPFGVVHIKGSVKSGTLGSPIFTLPVGPVGDRVFAVDSGNGSATGEVIVSSNGNVTAFSPTSNSRVHLDGIYFRP